MYSAPSSPPLLPPNTPPRIKVTPIPPQILTLPVHPGPSRSTDFLYNHAGQVLLVLAFTTLFILNGSSHLATTGLLSTQIAGSVIPRVSWVLLTQPALLTFHMASRLPGMPLLPLPPPTAAPLRTYAAHHPECPQALWAPLPLHVSLYLLSLLVSPINPLPTL